MNPEDSRPSCLPESAPNISPGVVDGTGQHVLVRWVSVPNGDWRYVKGHRGYYRAVHVDPALGCANGLKRSRGTVRIVAESHHIDGGIEGPRKALYSEMLRVAASYAESQGGLQVVGAEELWNEQIKRETSS